MEDTTQLEKLLSEYFAEQLAEPASLTEMEQTARACLLEVGRGAFEEWLSAVRTDEESGSLRCECGAETTYVRQRKASLRTVLGRVEYQRAYHVCGACGKGRYPLDKRLGLRPNAMSGELERLGGMLGVERPFEQGSRLFEAFTLLSLSDQSLDKAAQAYGEEQMRREANRRPQPTTPTRCWSSSGRSGRPAACMAPWMAGGCTSGERRG